MDLIVPIIPNNFSCHITKDLVRRLLTRDAICRKDHQWHLLNPSEMQTILEQTCNFRLYDFIVGDDKSKSSNRYDDDRDKLAKKFRVLKSDFLFTNRKVRGESTRLYQNLFRNNVDNYRIDDSMDNYDKKDKYLFVVPDWNQVQRLTIDHINQHYPFVSDLLNSFNNTGFSHNFNTRFSNEFKSLKLVVAGGSIFQSLHHAWTDDVDFFFVDENQERLTRADSDSEVKAVYDRALASIISYLTNRWFNDPLNGNYDEDDSIVYVARGEFVTTIYLSRGNGNEYKYQFIHRMYPSVGSILGGFDLGPAMVAYDGAQIVATELGAWSSLARTLIIDISRRSTSFEYRLKKYSRYCHLIFPGLEINTEPPETKEWKSSKETVETIMNIIYTNGYKVENNDDIQRRITKEKLEEQEVQKDTAIRIIRKQPDSSVDEVVRKIYKLIANHNYDTTLDPEHVRSSLVSNLHSSGKELSLLELTKLIQNTAYNSGFIIEMNAFMSYLYDNKENIASDGEIIPKTTYTEGVPKRFNPYLYDDHTDKEFYFLQYRSRILRLPRMKIELPSERNRNYSSEQMITIHTRRRDRNRELRDPHNINNKTFVKKEFTRSDYDDSGAWPIYLGEQNLVNLISGNVTGIVSILCFCSDKRKALEGYDGIYDAENTIEGCKIVINSDQNNNQNTRFLIDEALLTSFTNANLGDVSGAFNGKVCDTLYGRLTYRKDGGHINRLKIHFAEYASEIMNLSSIVNENDKREYMDSLSDESKKFINNIKVELLDRIQWREKEAKDRLNKGVNWIVKNPGRQWTSSINPIVLNARDWYGQYYTSFTIGNEPIETILRCLRKFTNSSWSILNNDVFEKLITLIIYNQ